MSKSIFDFDEQPIVPSKKRELNQLKKAAPEEAISTLAYKAAQELLDNGAPEYAEMPVMSAFGGCDFSYEKSVNRDLRGDVQALLMMPVSARRFGKQEVVTARQFVLLRMLQGAMNGDKAAAALLQQWVGDSPGSDNVSIGLSSHRENRTIELDQTTLQTMQSMGMDTSQLENYKNVTVIDQ